MPGEQVLNTGCNFNFLSFIFIADTHGFLNDFKKQEEIIGQVNPQFVLAEQLQDLCLDSSKKFNDIPENRKFILTQSTDVEKLIQLCRVKNISLIGIDLFNFGFDKDLQDVINGKREPSKLEEDRLQSILFQRQEHHLSIIQKYQKKSSKPIVIIQGAWHLQEDSLLMQSLDNYLVIYPANASGEMLLEPSSNKDIEYKTRIKQ